MVLGYIAGGIVFILAGFGIYLRYKKKGDKVGDIEKGLELAEKDLGEERDILEITKGLTNRTYFNEEERVKFLRELELMIEKTIEEWNNLFGSREVIEHIEKVHINDLKDVKRQERIPLPENIKKVLREKGISEETISTIENVRGCIIYQLNILLSVRDHVKTGGFVSITETQDLDTRFRSYMLKVRKKLDEVKKLIKTRELEESGVWEDLRVLRKQIAGGKTSLSSLRAIHKA